MYVKNEADAEVVLQEAAYKAIKKSSSLKDYNFVETWIYRIVINQAVSS
ncbi:hypothetical protein [Anaerostipes faecalis]